MSDVTTYFETFLKTVAERFGAPDFISAQSVTGGLSHRLFRVESVDGALALKVLSRRSVDSQSKTAHLERAETVAELAASAGIPALVARRGIDGNFLQNALGEQVLLWRWEEGETLPPSAASPDICEGMGAHLGALHALKLRFPGQNAPVPEAFPAGHFEALLRRGERENASWVPAIRDHLAPLSEANRRAMQAQRQLQNGWVTGHLDFDQKNVLWHRNQPAILDWESAKPIHPALELLGAGLSWAGQSAGEANRDSFAAFLRGYRSRNLVAPEGLATACEAVLGKWVIWLEFNLNRSLESEIRGTPEEKICHDALRHALGATLKLQEDVPLYRDWCADSQP